MDTPTSAIRPIDQIGHVINVQELMTLIGGATAVIWSTKTSRVET
jgi:hypothetical protein